MEKWQELLTFWFSKDESIWFGRNAAFDYEVRRLFGPTLDSLENGIEQAWRKSPRSCLALVLLLDQVPRNIFREQPRAFAFDLKALTASRQAIQDGYENQYSAIEKSFLYLPFEHSENIQDQNESVRLYQSLLARVSEVEKSRFAEHLEYAIKHLEIIKRFGRFPHRNKILGRISTPEELSFLNEPGSHF